MSKTKQKPTKVKRQKVKIGARTVRIKPIENDFHLTDIICYEFEGNNIGALLLQKGERYRLVFGFSSQGITNVIAQSEIDDIFDPIEAGLVDFPADETLTIHQSFFVDDSQRCTELDGLIEQCTSPELKFFLLAEKQRTQQLSAKGLRKKIELNFYCSYTFGEEGKKSKDLVESTLKKLEGLFTKVSGTQEATANFNLQQRLEEGYYEGYERWFNFLSNKLKLNVTPQSKDELWNNVVKRLSNENIPAPQTLYVSEYEGLSLEKNSALDPISKIYSKTEIPTADVNWVYNNQKYVAAMTLVEKADGYKDKRTQLKSLWKVLMRPEVYDTEVFTQLTLGSIRMMRMQMQSLMKQSLSDSESASKKNNIDVQAEMKIKKAIEAQEELYENRVPFKTATVFLIHRNTKKQLNKACNDLASQFPTPLELFRESTYAYQVWLQTIPIHWGRLHYKPYDRRWDYLNNEAPAITPLVTPASEDTQGIELISIEGGNPIYLDLWKTVRHLLIVATNRAGKGILVTRLILHHLARGVPVSIVDYPRADGTSTYTYLCEFLGDKAAYFNTVREKFNLFEVPDLKNFSHQQQQERMADFKDSLINILYTMVIGLEVRAGVNPDIVESLLTLAVDKFYSPDNQEIFNRFTAAYKGGFGSPEWQNTPVLEDFIEMIGPERLEIINPTSEILRMLELIKVRLNYWLKTKIGNAISKPSSIKADSLLTVYALANLSSEEEANVMALAVNLHVLRKSMSHEKSCVFIDEVSIWIKYNAIAKAISQYCANGAKSGIQVMLAGQQVTSIAKSPYGESILDNVPIKLIGRVERSSLKGIVNTLEYDREIVNPNASKVFLPNKQNLATKWLLEADNRINLCNYYADSILLAAAANNPDEEKLRQELSKDLDNKYQLLKQFADRIVAKLTK